MAARALLAVRGLSFVSRRTINFDRWDVYNPVSVALLNRMGAVRDLEHVPAWAAGAGGGAVASIGQFVGNSLNDCVEAFFAGDTLNGVRLLGVFFVATAILMFAGAVVGFFMEAKTPNRWSLFLAGAAATAIGTMALPAVKPLLKRVDLSPISISYAANEDCRAKPISFGAGLRAFFNLDEPRYRVIVGSFKRPEEAAQFAAKLNAENKGLRAFVGERAPCNEYYPVVVGDDLNQRDAKRLQDQVLEMTSVTGAYLSPVNR